ncbi:MAG: DUF58 domain-containing protein [Blastocatellia bacterium]
MIFTRRFYLLFALGILPLLAAWSWPGTRWLVLVYDVALILTAWLDWRRAADVAGVEVRRLLTRRFMIGAENEVQLSVINRARRKVTFTVRDEYPPDLELRGERTLTVTPKRSEVITGYRLFAAARGDYHFGDIVLRWPAPLRLAIRQLRVPAAATVKVYPNINEAKKHEIHAMKNRLLQAGQRRINYKGQGREFESLRDYVRGDELRHISWTATARRGKLVTRQYQIERNQSIVVMLDAGRLMTSRIEHLSKLDHAINAALSIGYVAVSGGDNIGLLTFTRQVTAWLPPQRGHAQMNAIIEALYNVKPQMTEPSYARAFQYFQQNCKRRSLVIILTDLVDRDASAELLAHTATLLPRHLPLIVTIGDKDLRSLVAQSPKRIADVYQQSVAEELLQQREEALARITELGGLALDVPAGQLAFQLVNKYLEVKERGLL